MKTSISQFLIIGFLQLTITLNAQHLKVGDEISLCKQKYVSENNNTAPGYWTYDNTETEFTYCFDGKSITNKVTFPLVDKKKKWIPVELGNRIYFTYSTFEKDIYSLYYAKYNVINNKIEEPKMVLQTESKSSPEMNINQAPTLENKNYFALMTYAGAGNYSETSISFKMSSTVVTVLDYELNILYSVNLPFEYTEKEFLYDIANLLGDDGTWYRFGIKNEVNSKGKYGCFITNPEGNTSKFKTISDNADMFTLDINLDIDGDKIIQYGFWSNLWKSNEMSGTYYVEFDAKDLSMLTTQIKTFDSDDLLKFTNVNSSEKKIENRKSINGIKKVNLSGDDDRFVNGNYVAVYRRKVNTMETSYSFEVSCIFVATFGPTEEQMTVNIIKINQASPGLRAGFECGATIMHNKLIIIFNDNIANTNSTIEAEPKVFEPFPGQTKTIATFAVFINETGEISREQILSYSEDNLFFHEMGSKIDGENLYIYTVNDHAYNYYKSGDADKISKRVVHFVE